MPRDRPWWPTLRCLRCRRPAPVDALRALLLQPVTPDGGPVHFECHRCRADGAARAWPERPGGRPPG
jgi:hypothetical protein